MTIHFFRAGLAGVLLALFSGGCVSKPFRGNQGASVPGGAKLNWTNAPSVSPRGTINATTGKPQPYDLAFVEFGEEGSALDPSQLMMARQLLTRRSPRKKPPLLVLYIHGWHHNARPGDSDVERFKQALDMLGSTIKKRDVVGIYLGWQGAGSWMTNIAGADTLLTYYSRKEAGTRLADNYDCLNTISSLLRDNRTQNGRALVVGHSFGGLVLERAIKSELANPTANYGGLLLKDSLVVMMNPATESVLTRQIVDTMNQRIRYSPESDAYLYRTDKPGADRNGERYGQGNEPAVVSITSRNDHATGFFFHRVSQLWWVLHPTRGWQDVNTPATDAQINAGTWPQASEQKFLVTTAGHNSYLPNLQATFADPSRTAIATKKISAAGPTVAQSGVELNLAARPAGGALQFSTTAIGQKQHEGASVESWKSANAATLWKLDRGNRAQTPYWIIQVPKVIINNHGGIWNDNSVALLAAIYRMKFPSDVAGPNEAAPRPGPSMTERPVTARVLRAQVSAIKVLAQPVKPALPPAPAPGARPSP